MTIADQLTLLSSTKTAIKQAIEDKGVTVGAVPFADYPTKIAAISGGGSTPAQWVRPADWLPLPAVTETDQKFVGLHAIYPDANFVALSAAGDYTVDWGDGVVENFAANAIAQHEYNYDTYDTGNATLSSSGYKQAVVTLTPQAGQNLTALNLHHCHSALTVQYSSGFLDIALAGQFLTDLRIGVQTPGSGSQVIRFADLERVNIVRSSVVNFSYLFYGCYSLQAVVSISTDAVSGVNMSYMFSNCYSLTSVPQFDTSAVTSMNNMFNNCYSLASVPQFDTSAVTSMSGMFQGCFSITSVPLFNTATVTNMGSMFSNCSSLTSVPQFNTAAVTSMSNMFSYCYSLTSVPLFNTAKVTNMGSMFSNCSSLTSVPQFNTAAVTSMSNMFSGCLSLSKVSMTGMKVSFSVANCKLSAERLNEIYSNLAVVTGQTITVTGNYGTASDDPTIATAKGWTVTG